MSDLRIRIATKEDLPMLNQLYADMDNKPLLSKETIGKKSSKFLTIIFILLIWKIKQLVLLVYCLCQL